MCLHCAGTAIPSRYMQSLPAPACLHKDEPKAKSRCSAQAPGPLNVAAAKPSLSHCARASLLLETNLELLLQEGVVAFFQRLGHRYAHVQVLHAKAQSASWGTRRVVQGWASSTVAWSQPCGKGPFSQLPRAALLQVRDIFLVHDCHSHLPCHPWRSGRPLLRTATSHRHPAESCDCLCCSRPTSAVSCATIPQRTQSLYCTCEEEANKHVFRSLFRATLLAHQV